MFHVLNILSDMCFALWFTTNFTNVLWDTSALIYVWTKGISLQCMQLKLIDSNIISFVILNGILNFKKCIYKLRDNILGVKQFSS